MKLTVLPQVGEPLYLPLSLVRVQVLLDFRPILEKLVFLDLAEAVVHTSERLQEEAKAAACLHVGCRCGPLMVTELSDRL